MIRWDPVREVVTLRDAMDKLFQDAVVQNVEPGTPSNGSAFAIPVDVYQNSKQVVVKATLPGVRPDDLQLTFEQGHLIIRGEVKSEREVDGSYLVRERRSGKFGRVIPVPSEIEVGSIDAAFEQGVLTVTLPKAESVQPRQIKVRADQAS